MGYSLGSTSLVEKILAIALLATLVACGGETETGDDLSDASDASDIADASIMYRVQELVLRDPHIAVEAPFIGCIDLTDEGAPMGLAPSVNSMIQTSITTDDDADGDLDLSLLMFVNPLETSPGGSGLIRIGDGRCSSPLATTVCSVDSADPLQDSSYSNSEAGATSDCLGLLDGTTSDYSPPVSSVAPDCYVSDEVDLVLDIGGIMVELESARVSAQYSADGEGVSMVGGLIRGFMSEQRASEITLPDDLPVVGGQPVDSILPGSASGCSTIDARDTGPDGSTLGWWFYLNFEASAVDTDATW
ncbi:MAG: hypothetical protein HOI23_10875 [Deltaproteobacteria bacterium]|jgi:hypothetical protein|nr:hypothetical protein [Deltaproteobacteria bacterium]MBT6433379.1 hypothetical protein [Deltaproteobacteria bacterium]MBT6492281.1 hypothetical protein [Deltaproteobacteria bacterium]